MFRLSSLAHLRASARALICAVVLLAVSVPALAARTVLVFGDSLSAGYGIRQDAAWPNLLGQRLAARGFDYSVVNASISGETTSGGRSRLDAALERHRPTVLILALGSNDGLRGLPVRTVRDNLNAMIDSAQKHKVRVLLLPQHLPPNYGPYADDFAAVFPAVAKARKVALGDYLLADIATELRYFQADQLHPTAEAQPILLDTVWRRLEPLLKGR